MNAKKIVTAVLLLFVVGSLAWFGVQEVRHARAVQAARESLSGSTAPKTSPVAAHPSPILAPGEDTSKAAPVTTPQPLPAPAPVSVKIQPAPGAKVDSGPAVSQKAGSKVIVYYLHTTARCPSCLKIEAYTAAEMTGPLAGPLSEGRLEWKVLNVDEPKNAHFTEDYQLYTKSVVISDIRDGKEARWKRLDKVWDYLDDQKAFMQYVDEEVRAYLKNLS